MKISTDIKPVSYLKSRAKDMLDQVNETRRSIVITQNGEPKAVLQDTESFENMRNAIGILKLIPLVSYENIFFSSCYFHVIKSTIVKKPVLSA